MDTAGMTSEQAQAFRAAYDGAVKRYSKMTRAALAAEEQRLMADQGTVRVYGGPVSKDELISAVLDRRGYTIGKLNLAVHVIAHDVPWPDCPHCKGT